MTTNLQKAEDPKAKALVLAIEQAVTAGNLALLNPEQKLFYYKQVCESVGMNPLTRPLDFIQLNGKLVLYVKKDGTDQLRKINSVSITKLEQKIENDCAVVMAYATDKAGKVDSDVGAVSVAGLKGEAYSNALMKAVTKAKRRVTLSISGMGLLDESEIESIPGARSEDFNPSASVQAKSEAKTSALKDKLNAITPGAPEIEQKPVVEAAPAVATPPPVPAAAKEKAKDPEVLPKAEKAARGRPAKVAAPVAEEEKPIPTDEKELAAVQVPFGDYKTKPLDELNDGQLVEIAKFYKKNGAPSTPHFKWFKRVFDAYCKLFTIEGMDDLEEPEQVPPPAEEDPAAFMEQPFEAPPESNKFLREAIDSVRKAKTMEALQAAWTQVMKDCKDPLKINLKGLDVAVAKQFNTDITKAKEEKKAELAK